MTDEFRALRIRLRQQGVRLTLKTGWFWGALHWVVAIITLGGNRSFATHYITTLANTIAVPDWWAFDPFKPEMLATIDHELAHVRQFRKFGLGSAKLGLVPMGIVYLLLPLPMGLAWGRWVLERDAYLVGYKTLLGGGADRDALIAQFVAQMTTGRYGWTLLPVFRGYVRRWMEARL